MKKRLYLFIMCLMILPVLCYAMEGANSEQIGNTESASPNMPNSLQQEHENNESSKEKKKKKKNKKDTISDQLDQLAQGISPEDIDKQIIAKLKIYKTDLTQSEEKVIENYLVTIRNEATSAYNQLKQHILEEKTKVKRGLFTKEVSPEIKELQKAVVKLTVVSESQNACNQLLADAFRKNLEMQQQQLIIAKQSGETQSKQLQTMEQANVNTVAGYNLNKNWYAFMRPATVINSLLSVSALIVAIVALATE